MIISTHFTCWSSVSGDFAPKIQLERSLWNTLRDIRLLSNIEKISQLIRSFTTDNIHVVSHGLHNYFRQGIYS